MTVWKMLRTQLSLANSFRITRIYSTQCTIIQPWQSGWVWGMSELLGKMVCKQLFSLKGIFSNKNARIQYFQIPFKQNEMTCFIPCQELKELAVKQWLKGWRVFFLCRTRSIYSKNWRKDRGEEHNGYCACFILHPFWWPETLFKRNSVHIIYDLSALCKVMLPLTPCRVSTPIYKDRGWTKLLLKNQSLTSLRKRRKRCRPALLSSNQLTDHHAHLR